MDRALAAAVYSQTTVPRVQNSTPHVKQVRRRRAFRIPQDAFDPNQPDLIRVSLQ